MPTIRAICVFAICLLAATVTAARLPHLRLATQLAAGTVDKQTVKVIDFVPAEFREKTVARRCGELRFRTPESAAVVGEPEEDLAGVIVASPSLTCRINPPRHIAPDDADDSGVFDRPAASGQEEIRRRVALCTVSGQDLSFWMSREDVESLQQRLEVKPCVTMRAERIEVVRGEGLSGLLYSWTVEGKPRMHLDYFSDDNRIHGSAFFFAGEGCAEAVEQARAVVGSLRIEAGTLAEARPTWPSGR